MPESVHLYMLVAGIVLGVLLGPAVLGNAAPNLYDKLFLGSGDMSEVEKAEEKIAEFEASDEYTKRMENVQRQAEMFDAGDSPQLDVQAQMLRIVNEQAQAGQQLREAWVDAYAAVELRRSEHGRQILGLSTLLLLLVGLVMLIEPILAPQKNELDAHGRAEFPAALSRLITARYALLGGWLTLALAKPDWLLSINPVVAIILAALVGLAAFVPLGKSATSD